MTRKANLDLIAEHWDDLLRLAGSLKFGHATASCSSASSRPRAGRTPWPRRSRSCEQTGGGILCGVAIVVNDLLITHGLLPRKRC
ncbi:Tn3 family transposase [Nocardia sp. NPDC051833]|uniref:Tn3 family transposase n=1 Tax=Nocardia sp. NPDC051833 TaxID=3155674 RepID=UPI003431C0FD